MIETRTRTTMPATPTSAVVATQIREGALLEDLAPEAHPFELLREQLSRDGWNPDTGYESLAEPLIDVEAVVASVSNEDWMDRSLCAQIGGDAFFPGAGGHTGPGKRPCSTCEVRPECLEYALANDEEHGIWGGLSRPERQALKHTRAA